MNTHDRAWKVSSYTGSNGNCVEVADEVSPVLVRDTKNRRGGHITVSPKAWTAFVKVVSR